MDNRMFEDFARAANGAMGALTGLRDEIEAQIRARLDAWVKGQNLVARDEFETVKAMAAKARMENEALAARIAALESQLAKK